MKTFHNHMTLSPLLAAALLFGIAASAPPVRAPSRSRSASAWA